MCSLVVERMNPNLHVYGFRLNQIYSIMCATKLYSPAELSGEYGLAFSVGETTDVRVII